MKPEALLTSKVLRDPTPSPQILKQNPEGSRTLTQCICCVRFGLSVLLYVLEACDREERTFSENKQLCYLMLCLVETVKRTSFLHFMELTAQK